MPRILIIRTPKYGTPNFRKLFKACRLLWLLGAPVLLATSAPHASMCALAQKGLGFEVLGLRVWGVRVTIVRPAVVDSRVTKRVIMKCEAGFFQVW